MTGNLAVPLIISLAGDRAAMRSVEFFTVTIRNPNTRAAYARACSQFLAWCDGHSLALPAIHPVHVAAWVEGLGHQLAAPTVKQQLAAVRMLFDWLGVGQIVPTNPAAHVRGPSHVVNSGKTAMLTRDEAKALLAGIPTNTLMGLRDRALVATLFYTFSRVSALLGMRVGDYYPVGKQWWLRRREKGGKEPFEFEFLPAHVPQVSPLRHDSPQGESILGPEAVHHLALKAGKYPWHPSVFPRFP